MKCVDIVGMILMFRSAYAFTTCTGGTIGNNPVTSYASTITTTGSGYLLEDEIYQVTCCGSISRWEIRTSGAGTVQLQIWRKTGTYSYTLIGKNEYTASGAGFQALNVASADRISVQHGDMIGWYSSPNIIMHAASSGYPVTNRRSSSITDLAVGSIHDWASENTFATALKFAIKATTVASTLPTFTFGTTEAVQIDDITPAETNILSLTVSDDGGDTIVYSTAANDNAYFYVDTNNGQVKTLQTNIPEGTYTITPMVTDDCYNTATTVVTVTVANVAITSGGFTGTSVTISEDDNLETNLTNILITEPNDGYYCYLTSDSNYPFSVRQANSLYPGYTLYLQDWPELNAATTPSYTLTAECIEAHSSSPASVSVGSFTVNVSPNSGPSIATATATVTLDAVTDWTGTLVYTVVATDPENDPFTFTLAGGGPFTITDAGKIVLTENLVRHAQGSYALTATVADNRGNSDAMTVTVTINNRNVDPTFTNLPTSESITENVAVGTTVFQPNAVDTDVLEYYAQFNPSYGAKLFTVNPNTGEVLTSANIDYDVISDHSIAIFITVSDGKWFDTQRLIVNIGNEYETPVIAQKYFKIMRDEGVSGDSFPVIRYDVDDPDIASVNDVMIYTKNCGADDSRVAISSTTGIFSFNGDYDLDDASNPTDFTCTVTVTDSGGLTDTCIVDVRVDYVNEFTPTFTQSSYDISVLYTELVGTIVLSVSASDQDLGDHGVFFYEIINAEKLFGIFQNGSIFVNKDLIAFYPNGHMLLMTVKAEDTGGLFTTISINVTIPPSIVESTTTEKPLTFFEYRMNMVAYEIAAAVGAACLLVAIFFACRYIRRKPPVTEVKPVTLPQVSENEAKNGIVDQSNKNDNNKGDDSNVNKPPSNNEEPQLRVRPLFNIEGPRTADGGMQSPPPAYNP
ncbi:protocadherin Fat 4-like [Mytilus californianus]|uniref:protocadherin Fat 4-like n=1 Tax=Mytilus californianus TaxID=6549 RepID=UPI002246613B|nr:protocadherin Fat 4-like [Mytilus californianus]